MNETHLVNPTNIQPTWRHHPTKPVFVADTGFITSEPKYRDAINYQLQPDDEPFTIEQLVAYPRNALPQPLPTHQPKTLNPYCNKHRRNFWYITVPFHKQTYAIHSLVAETFLSPPRPDHKYIAFIDGNKNNCTAINLEYTTRKELERRKAQTNTNPHPLSHPVDVLRPDLSIYGSYPTLSDAAKALNVTLSRVSEAYNGIRPSIHGYTILARPDDQPIPLPYAQQHPPREQQPHIPQDIPDVSGLEGEY